MEFCVAGFAKIRRPRKHPDVCKSSYDVRCIVTTANATDNGRRGEYKGTYAFKKTECSALGSHGPIMRGCYVQREFACRGLANSYGFQVGARWISQLSNSDDGAH